MDEKIIIVEDDESIRRLLEVALKSHGYQPLTFDNARAALAEIRKATPDLAIFDIMMEDLDGMEAVKLLRRHEQLKTLPVIMLTAKDTELDKILGLDAGADDYMTKPFSVLELCARVRAQLRRAGARENNEEAPITLEYGDLSLNTATRELAVAGINVELTFKEFELLKVLMEHPKRALTRPELLAKVWGEDYYGETRTLDIHIGTLRQKLGDNAENSRYIKTVRGAGYRFIGGREK